MSSRNRSRRADRRRAVSSRFLHPLAASPEVERAPVRNQRRRLRARRQEERRGAPESLPPGSIHRSSREAIFKMPIESRS